MICIDCGQIVTEAERINARACVRCKGMMHAECTMAGADEEVMCEVDFFEQRADIQKAMKAMGVEA